MAHHSPDDFVASDFLHPKFWPMWVFFGFLRLMAMLPFRAMLRPGKIIGKIIQVLSGRRQRVVDINLKHCFPELSPEERQQVKNRCYENVGISLMEISMCWWWPEHRLKPLVEVRGREHVDSALSKGKGVILLSGHFTSLEIGGRLLVLDLPMQVMYQTQKNRLFNSYLYSKRNSYFVNTISRKNTRQLIKGIRNLIPTWYAPDQNFRRERNVFAPFMGVPTATITASSRLAQSSNAVMLPFYPERKSDGSGYILWIEPALENFPSDDELADATRINASIEKFVRRNPDQYFWMHQRFKTRPDGETGFYN